MEEFKPRSKEEFITEMYKHYDRQKELCELKWKKTNEIEESKLADVDAGKKTKRENTDLKEYNNQVAALGKTVALIINITKSILPSDDEEADEDDIL